MDKFKVEAYVKIVGKPTDQPLHLTGNVHREIMRGVTLSNNSEGYASLTSFVKAEDKYQAWRSAGPHLQRAVEILGTALGTPLVQVDEYSVFVEPVLESPARSGPHLVAALMPRINGGSSVSSVELNASLSEFNCHRLAEVIEQDTEAATALRLFGTSEHTWDNLSKVLEVIESDVGDTNIWEHGWVSRRQIRRFTSTANSRKAVGDAARHGHGRYEAPKHPMLLQEAVHLIHTILQRWIDWKLSGMTGG